MFWPLWWEKSLYPPWHYNFLMVFCLFHFLQVGHLTFTNTKQYDILFFCLATETDVSNKAFTSSENVARIPLSCGVFYCGVLYTVVI